MGFSLMGWIRSAIGGVGFSVFLWANEMTEEDYFAYIYEQERAHKRKAMLDGDDTPGGRT